MLLSRQYGLDMSWRGRISCALLSLFLLQSVDAFVPSTTRLSAIRMPDPRQQMKPPYLNKAPKVRQFGATQLQKDDDDFDNEESGRPEPIVFENVKFLENVNKAATTTAYAFLVIGFLLNIFGYDFLVQDGKLTIDTLEKRQFQNEVTRTTKQRPVSPIRSED